MSRSFFLFEFLGIESLGRRPFFLGKIKKMDGIIDCFEFVNPFRE